MKCRICMAGIACCTPYLLRHQVAQAKASAEAFVEALADEYGTGEPVDVLNDMFESLGITIMAGEGSGHSHAHHGHSHGSERHNDEDEKDHGHDHHDHDQHNDGQVLEKRQDEEPAPELCQTPAELVTSLKITNIDRDSIPLISPALLTMKLLSTCNPTASTASAEAATSQAQVWGYAILANLGLAVVSVLGVSIVPFLKSPRAEFLIINGFMALAVGVLLGDATIHIIPSVIGYAASLDEQAPTHSHASSLLYSVLIFFGAYMFYFLDTLLASVAPLTHVLHQFLLGRRGGDKLAKPSQHDSRLQAAAMVLVGDGLHNVADGFAIGAAFLARWQIGVSTTIAILLHELPHELGDFAILLRAGICPSRAIILNGVVSLTSLLGTVIAILVLQSLPESSIIPATNGILSVVAGNFLYLALAVLLNELKEGKSGKHHHDQSHRHHHQSSHVMEWRTEKGKGSVGMRRELKVAENNDDAADGERGNGLEQSISTMVEGECFRQHHDDDGPSRPVGTEPECVRPGWAPVLFHGCILLGVALMAFIALYAEDIDV